MATHDYNIANDTGANVRTDINNVLKAIRSNNSNGGPPPNNFAFQYHVDTTPGSGQAIMKVRDDVGGATGSAYINLFEVKAEGQTFIGDGTITKPGLAFRSDINSGLRRSTDGAVSIVTASTRRLTVLSDGKVGIAQNTPTEALHVTGNIKTTGNIDIASGNIVNGSPAIGTSGFNLQDDGVHQLGRNTVAGNSVLQVFGGTGLGEARVKGDGDLQNTNNSYGAISDSRLKENIVDAGSQWNDIKDVRVRNYNFKLSTGFGTHTQIGVIAQELETISPGLVKESNDEDADGNSLGTTTKTVSYSVLYMKAVKALQEAMERIETLEAKVAALEAGS